MMIYSQLRKLLNVRILRAWGLFIGAGLCLGLSGYAVAGEMTDSLRESLRLMSKITTGDERGFMTSIPIVQIDGNSEESPLARYIPVQGGRIEIADKTDMAHKDFAYLSTIQDRSQRPAFEQYLATLTFLNIANELAHALQHRNGSLDDFYALYHQRKINEACGLYSLQQHVSDIAMLEKAMRLEHYFLGQGHEKGIRALHLALERNNLIDEYDTFRQAVTAKDMAGFNHIKNQIRMKREWQNMKGLSFCESYTSPNLSGDIVERATAPVMEFSNFMKSDPTPQHGRTEFYPAGRD